MTISQTALEKAEALDLSSLTRPAPVLRSYYVVVAMMTGPLFPFAVVPLLIKYFTLRYRFDESGISMSWGFVFRREIYLTYRRIQDIHVTRNLLQRWMGLATVAVQTASGHAAAEMKIEGILEIEQLRDYLYNRMRGARGEDTEAIQEAAENGGASSDLDGLALLKEIRDSLKLIADHLVKDTP